MCTLGDIVDHPKEVLPIPNYELRSESLERGSEIKWTTKR